MFISAPAAASVSPAAASTTAAAAGGYGYMVKRQTAATVKTFTVMINDTTPLWFYCAQAKHCQSGMTMVVNVNNNVPLSLHPKLTLVQQDSCCVSSIGGESAG